MPDLPISGLPAASALNGTEQIAVVQGGVTKRCSIADILAWILNGVPDTAILYNNGGAINGDAQIVRVGAGAFEASTVIFLSLLTNAGPTFQVDNLGAVQGGDAAFTTVSSGNGTNYVGPVAQISVVAGIVDAVI